MLKNYLNFFYYLNFIRNEIYIKRFFLLVQLQRFRFLTFPAFFAWQINFSYPLIEAMTHPSPAYLF